MLRCLVKLAVDVVMGRRGGKGGYYAVRVGRQTGVFSTWSECESYVKGYSGARFKRFDTNDQAQDFAYGGCSSPSSSSSSSGGYSPPSPPQQSYSNKRSYNYNDYQPSYSSSYSSTSSYGGGGGKRFKGTQYLDTLPSSSYSTSSSSSSSSSSRPVVYSDGCCTNNGYGGARAGIGVYWGPGNKRNASERLQGRQTNQRAEIMAAVKALESAKDMGFNRVEVRTDSKYTINGATSWVKTWKNNGWKTVDRKEVKNMEEFQKLDKLCNEIDVQWTHVAGHAGIDGNEKADELAKQGASKSPV